VVQRKRSQILGALTDDTQRGGSPLLVVEQQLLPCLLPSFRLGVPRTGFRWCLSSSKRLVVERREEREIDLVSSFVMYRPLARLHRPTLVVRPATTATAAIGAGGGTGTTPVARRHDYHSGSSAGGGSGFRGGRRTFDGLRGGTAAAAAAAAATLAATALVIFVERRHTWRMRSHSFGRDLTLQYILIFVSCLYRWLEGLTGRLNRGRCYRRR